MHELGEANVLTNKRLPIFVFQVALAHNNLTNIPWDLNKDNIFQHIDIFIIRCKDMIEICQAMIDFAR